MARAAEPDFDISLLHVPNQMKILGTRRAPSSREEYE
jgi:hypothetical protein